MTALLLAIAALFLNAVPDIPEDVVGVVCNASQWPESDLDLVSLYTLHLPSGWSRHDVVMTRPLGRVQQFVRAVGPAGERAGLLLYAAREPDLPEDDLELGRRLEKIGASVASTGMRFVLVDGLFKGLPTKRVLAAARAFRRGLDTAASPMHAGLTLSAERVRDFPVVAGALAAKDAVPFVRLDNAVCMERTVKDMPYVAMATMAKVAYPKGAVRFYDDADTSPHNLWSRSAATLSAKLAVSFFAGAQGGVLWYVGQRTPDGYPTNPLYAKSLSARGKLFRTLARELENSVPAGIAVPLSRKDLGLGSANWGEFAFGSFGIPFYATYDLDTPDVRALMGSEAVAQFSVEDLYRLFKGRILVDGDAARALTERGLSKLLGAKAERHELDYNCERLENGTFMRLSRSASVPRLVPLSTNDGCRVLSHLVRRAGATDRYAVVAPASLLTTNALGGCVLTTVYNCRLEPWNLRSEARRDQLLEFLELLSGGPLPVCCKADQDVLVLTRRKDGKTYVLTVNLGFDPVTPLLEFGGRPSESESLGADGAWCLDPPEELPCAGFSVRRF